MSSNTESHGVLRADDPGVADEHVEASTPQISQLFCSCGGLLVPESEGWGCRDCGTTAKGPSSFTVVDEQREQPLRVVTEQYFRGPKTRATCPECGHDEAYSLLAQLRSADESETRMLTCAACEHNWREND